MHGSSCRTPIDRSPRRRPARGLQDSEYTVTGVGLPVRERHTEFYIEPAGQPCSTCVESYEFCEYEPPEACNPRINSIHKVNRRRGSNNKNNPRSTIRLTPSCRTPRRSQRRARGRGSPATANRTVVRACLRPSWILAHAVSHWEDNDGNQAVFTNCKRN